MNQTGYNGMSVDWSRPIEAVDNNGKVCIVMRLFSPEGTYHVSPILDGGWFAFKENGEHSSPFCDWRIRNVAQPAPTPDDLTKRMEALVRDMATLVGGATYSQLQTEARAIVALLPAPVDPDLIAAREVVVNMEDRTFYSWRIRDGEHDDSIIVRASLSAIKRGRALERGEG